MTCSKKIILIFVGLVLIFIIGLSETEAGTYDSNSFQVSDPVMNAGGYGSSENYQLFGSISGIAIGTSTSANFKDNAGFLYFPFASTPVVSATAGNGQVALSWTSSVGYLGWTASAYNVGWSTNSGGPYSYTTSLGGVTSYTQTGLSNGISHYFIVRAEDALGDSIATSTEASASPAASVPPAPSSGSGPTVAEQPLRAVFTGRAYPYSPVTLLRDAQVSQNTIANAEGIFQIQVRGISSGGYIFSIYAQDNTGRSSRALVIPITITADKTSKTSGIFIPPTLTADKLKVKKDEIITFSGQAASLADILLFIDGNASIVQGVSDKDGNYRISLSASDLSYGSHKIEAQSALNKNTVSELSRFFEFEVGEETVFVEPDEIICAPVDLNDDNRINLIDFSVLIYWFGRTNPPAKVDFNSDGVVDIYDFSILAYYWTG